MNDEHVQIVQAVQALRSVQAVVGGCKDKPSRRIVLRPSFRVLNRAKRLNEALAIERSNAVERLERISVMKRPDPQPFAEALPVEQRRAQAERLMRTWETPAGWRYWSSVNNTDVGLWYTGLTFIFLLFGGVLALLMRIQLAVPDNDFLPPNFITRHSPFMAR